MEKWFKYFLCVVIVGLFIGVLIAMNMPKPSMTIYEEGELERGVRETNSDLPRKIGTIGILDSIVYHNRTIIYNLTVFGDSRIKEIYKANYNEFKDMLKYSVLILNGQRNRGDEFSSLLKEKELNYGARIYTRDGESTEWNISGSELDAFVKFCKETPTEALRTVIDMHLKIANLDLPISIEDVRNPMKSVALNTILGDLDESCLLQAVSHIGKDILFEYSVDENVIDLVELEKYKDDPYALDFLASTLARDEDIREFFGIMALSHSNCVFCYEGRKSHKIVSIRIPYSIIKKHCKIPQYLLS